jgi:hypothetical protein
MQRPTHVAATFRSAYDAAYLRTTVPLRTLDGPLCRPEGRRYVRFTKLSVTLTA